ncbi:collagenase 3-like [Daphnia pulicaria]|uniref:collagenase 3-like n=1 Tax=Daphnia pulicaria TaxID=35523 RepID=UPI001EEBC9FD|nr:collagenase 3-like [Daphnia pulicaria]
MFFSLILFNVVVNQLDASLVPPEAKSYLASFGYLHPKYKNSTNSFTSGDTIRRNAVSDFKSFSGLDPTGIVHKEILTRKTKPRCDLPDRIILEGSFTRRKRNIDIKGNRWTKDELTYGISKYTPDLEKSVVDREIAKAFRLWEEVTPLSFTFVETGNVDIEIR